MMAISAETRQGLELLRPIFAGIAARHDRVASRLTVAEQDFNQFLIGPSDNGWAQNKIIGFHGLTIREPQLFPVTEDDVKRITAARPDAKFAQFKDRKEQFYVQTAVNSQLLFTGDIPGFAQLKAAGHDAGFFALRLLQETPVELNLPELVPLAAVGAAHSVSGSTLLPSNLFERWILFVHILGWQSFRRIPFRAERVLWHENFQFSGDPERIPKELEMSPFAEQLRDKIPLPPRYFASTLIQDPSLASVYAIDTLLAGRINAPLIEAESFRKRLAAVSPGRPQAAEYHKLVSEIVTLVFEPDLRNPVLEDKIHEGRGRIDIVFDNAAGQGYFSDIQFRHGIKCPVVFFECKNYSNDISGPEFAQLALRLSEKRSKVGFIVCRTVDDNETVLKKCKDQFNDYSNHIVVLTDDDLLELLEAKAKNDNDSVARCLHAKWRPIFMNQ
jgi:hypothetical protein